MEAVKCEAFLAAAELGSLTATAELLGYTQSGVTRMIGTLEEELGFPLFLRSKKGVQLTENGKLMLPLLREEAELALPAAKMRWLQQFDLITCVPTAPERRRQRGFDVPQELFAGLFEGRSVGMEVLLERVRHTQPLYELKPEERKQELAGCFALLPHAGVRGKHVLLCDDIYTTGSTFAEAAQVLLDAGAARVSALALCAAQANWE